MTADDGELFGLEYSKWPRLLVTGDPVTREQANEIMVRTTRLGSLECNDKEWTELLIEAYGIQRSDNSLRADIPEVMRRAAAVADYKRQERREKALGVLSLSYLGNEQIASAYVGGPHGWCDWDGVIGTSRYSIGKWPTAGEIHADLELIAAAFPYLRMRVQAVSDAYVPSTAPDTYGEYVYSSFAPGTWRVHDGDVTYTVSPMPHITAISEDDEAAVVHRFTDPHGERGTTIERVREAIAQVESTYNPSRKGY